MNDISVEFIKSNKTFNARQVIAENGNFEFQQSIDIKKLPHCAIPQYLSKILREIKDTMYVVCSQKPQMITFKKHLKLTQL